MGIHPTAASPASGPSQQHHLGSTDLSHILADTYVLYSKTHGFHWNVTGPLFTSLHALFMEQYGELFEAIDEVAERIRVLDRPAPFGPGVLARLSAIDDAADNLDAMGMVRELETDHRLLASRCRKALALAQDRGDEGSADLLTQRLRVHEKTAWKLASLLR